jgi:cytoplasmic iron level regulating protein YaaA (DUF328/UPF0246 family)
MKKIALIACVSKKLDYKSKAKELYISPLFQKNMAYSKKIGVDKVYILSAKYGLLNLDDKVEPYDLTLNKMKTKEKKEWSLRILKELKRLEDFDSTTFVFLAGENYRKYLIEEILYYEIPMRGLKIGEQLQFLKKAIDE